MTRRPASRLRFTRLEDRLTPAGNLDPTFGAGGVAVVPPAVEAHWAYYDSFSSPLIVVQSDGKILVAKEVGVDRPEHIQVSRLNPDGTPDTTFGTAGTALVGTDIGGVVGLAVGPGGTVYVLANTSTTFNAELFRLTAAGQPDVTFDDDGEAGVWPAGSTYQYAGRLVVLPDGGALVGSGLLPTHFKRVAADGSPAGELHVPPVLGMTGQNNVWAVYPTADGGLLVVTNAPRLGTDPLGERIPVVIKLTAAGDLDPAYGTGGVTLLPVPGDQFNRVTPLGPDADGRLLVAVSGWVKPPDGTTGGYAGYPGGISVYGSSVETVVRLTADGRLDPTFAGDGSAELAVPGDRVLAAGTVLADGRVLVAARFTDRKSVV